MNPSQNLHCGVGSVYAEDSEAGGGAGPPNGIDLHDGEDPAEAAAEPAPEAAATYLGMMNEQWTLATTFMATAGQLGQHGLGGLAQAVMAQITAAQAQQALDTQIARDRLEQLTAAANARAQTDAETAMVVYQAQQTTARAAIQNSMTAYSTLCSGTNRPPEPCTFGNQIHHSVRAQMDVRDRIRSTQLRCQPCANRNRQNAEARAAAHVTQRAQTAARLDTLVQTHRPAQIRPAQNRPAQTPPRRPAQTRPPQDTAMAAWRANGRNQRRRVDDRLGPIPEPRAAEEPPAEDSGEGSPLNFEDSESD